MPRRANEEEADSDSCMSLQPLDIRLPLQFWDDEADAVRIEEGTLLPLWKFSTALASHKQVAEASVVLLVVVQQHCFGCPKKELTVG